MGTPRNVNEVMDLMRRNADESGSASHFIVTWDIGGTTVPYADLRRIMTDCGLGHIATTPIRTSSAMFRALKEMAEDQQVFPAWNDAEETIWTLNRIHKGDKQSKTVWLSREAWVSYHKTRKVNEPEVEYSSPEAEAKIAPILARYIANYTARDIGGRVLLPAIHSVGGFSLRTNGGMYMIVAPASGMVDHLRCFVDTLASEFHTGAHLTAFPVPDTDETRSDIRFHGYQSLVGQLNNSLRQLRDMLRENRTDENGRTKVASATVAKYLHSVDTLAQQAVLCKQVAQLGIDEINAALDKLREAYTQVQLGSLTIADFPRTIAGVEHAIERVENTDPQVES
jgi:hypothetical protein